MTCEHSIDPTVTIPAPELARGAIWCWGQQGDMHVEHVKTRDDGLLSVAARIISGRDVGHRDTWTLQPSQMVDIHDPSIGRVIR